MQYLFGSRIFKEKQRHSKKSKHRKSKKKNKRKVSEICAMDDKTLNLILKMDKNVDSNRPHIVSNNHVCQVQKTDCKYGRYTQIICTTYTPYPTKDDLITPPLPPKHQHLSTNNICTHNQDMKQDNMDEKNVTLERI
eukprot:253530_1